jgi:hypothetical protein
VPKEDFDDLLSSMADEKTNEFRMAEKRKQTVIEKLKETVENDE